MADLEDVTILVLQSGTTYPDLLRRRLIAALGAAPELNALTLPDLQDRWLTAQGFTQGTIMDRWAALAPGRNIKSMILLAV